MSVLTAVIWLLIWLLVIGLIFALCVWVLRDILGIAIPMHILKIVGAIIFLVVLLWFIAAVLGGGSFPVPRLG
jgi:hypothetical protein